jgi:hypothetical protein
MIKAGFGKNTFKRGFESILIYKLQKKGRLESNADNTSTSPRLLVIWRSDNRYEYSVGVLLIKYNNRITLDELKKLDYPPLALLRNSCNTKNTWVLDDIKVLIISKWEKQTRTIEITISEGTKKKWAHGTNTDFVKYVSMTGDSVHSYISQC